jgi:hypothetical protein
MLVNTFIHTTHHLEFFRRHIFGSTLDTSLMKVSCRQPRDTRSILSYLFNKGRPAFFSACFCSCCSKLDYTSCILYHNNKYRNDGRNGFAENGERGDYCLKFFFKCTFYLLTFSLMSVFMYPGSLYIQC